MKIITPRTVPWGPPAGSNWGFAEAPFTWTITDLSERYEKSIFKRNGGQFMSYRSWMTRLWSTLLKALERSMKTDKTEKGSFLSSTEKTK